MFVWISNGFFTKLQPFVRISDPIRNPDHLQPNLFLIIQNPDKSGFQIPTVFFSFLFSLLLHFLHPSTNFLNSLSNCSPKVDAWSVSSSHLNHSITFLLFCVDNMANNIQPLSFIHFFLSIIAPYILQWAINTNHQGKSNKRTISFDRPFHIKN